MANSEALYLWAHYFMRLTAIETIMMAFGLAVEGVAMSRSRHNVRLCRDQVCQTAAKANALGKCHLDAFVSMIHAGQAPRKDVWRCGDINVPNG